MKKMAQYGNAASKSTSPRGNVFVALAGILLGLLVVNGAEAQEHEEHFRPNAVALVVASTYEATEEANYFTLGAEYGRWFTERFGVVGEFEVLPELDAWVFVVPFVFKLAGEFEVFAGMGLEHLARRSRRVEGEELGHHEDLERRERVLESGADNLFLFRLGAGYHIPLGERFFMVPHVALDLIDEEEEVAKAVVYGVALGFDF